MSEITLDVGLAYKIKQALSRNGIPDVADLDWLATGNNIAEIRRVRLGHAKIITSEHVIYCSAPPLVPKRWSIKEHQKGEVFEWDPAKVLLYLDEDQKNDKIIKGKELYEKLKGKNVMNANVLDYLLAFPHLIPKEWEDERVFFWGTIYHYLPGDTFCIRCLYWDNGEWLWDALWFDHYFSAHNPAAVFAD